MKTIKRADIEYYIRNSSKKFLYLDVRDVLICDNYIEFITQKGVHMLLTGGVGIITIFED